MPPYKKPCHGLYVTQALFPDSIVALSWQNHTKLPVESPVLCLAAGFSAADDDIHDDISGPSLAIAGTAMEGTRVLVDTIQGLDKKGKPPAEPKSSLHPDAAPSLRRRI